MCAGLGLFLVLSSCSLRNKKTSQQTKHETTRQVSNDASFIPSELILSRHAFLGWRPDLDHGTSAVDPAKLPAKKVDCEDQNLYPTHPDMTTKAYHLAYFGRYDYRLLEKDQPGCMIGGLTKLKGVFPCLSSDVLRHVIISDTYQDRCGNHYRGFVRVVYLQKEENMGTLFSRGRTMYPNPKSQFANDFIVGGTYAVPASEMTSISELFEGDLEMIRRGRERALQGDFVFNGQTFLFSVKNSAR